MGDSWVDNTPLARESEKQRYINSKNNTLCRITMTKSINIIIYFPN